MEAVTRGTFVPTHRLIEEEAKERAAAAERARQEELAREEAARQAREAEEAAHAAWQALPLEAKVEVQVTRIVELQARCAALEACVNRQADVIELLQRKTAHLPDPSQRQPDRMGNANVFMRP